MDAPAGLGLGHPLDPVNAALELQPGKDPLAVDPRHQLAQPAKIALGHLHDLKAPALRLGVFLIHPHQVGGKQRRLLAAGAGSDLQYRRARIGGILGQKCKAQPFLHRRQGGAQPRQLFLGQGAHLGIGAHRLGLGQIDQGAGMFGDPGHHRLQLGIFPAERRDLGRRRPGRKPRLDKLEAAPDRVKLVHRQHGR